MQLARASLAEMLCTEIETEVSIAEAITHYLERFAELEPQIHAFVPEEQLELRLNREKEQLLASFAALPAKPELWGIPVGIKDLIHVEGLPTRAGSQLPAEALIGKEGTLIKRLRGLGAIIAGKTVTEEFAYQGPIATRNPRNLAHTPGGSSAGSAAAVAAGMCPLAVGTQTLRSVLAPASFCGVVGFKASYGRIPMDGLIQLSPSFDAIGFFTQDFHSMEVAAELLIPDFVPRQISRKPVLGIPQGVYMQLMSDEVKAVFDTQIESLEKLGYQVKHVKMPWQDELIYGDAMLRFIEGEMARGHEDLFEQYAGYYGEPVKEGIARGKQVTDAELKTYRGMQLELRQNLEVLMKEEGIDLWVSPAQGGTAPKLEENRTGWAGMTAVWGFAGCPALSIPAASIDNMPLGFQCVGSYGGDEWLLAWSREVARDLSMNK
ncbi:Putative amidase AmiD [Paenibacillus auburnensis]|uniref:Amidase AmiD n=2 Tax=Paenibacillus auburnensis TaxID=2905649 RepID=A0ABN8GG10_9BACL|nr:Putative amidase AmiD [Paenibacillus auburnensis]